MSDILADPILKNIFGKIKFIQSKREPKSLEDLLVKSYFYMEKPKFGVTKCENPRCKTCPNLMCTDMYYFHEVGLTYYIKQTFDCTAKDCIYVMTCKKCYLYYIGKTVNLRNRMTNHRLAINTEILREMKVSKHMWECGGGDFWVTPFYKMKKPGLIAHLVTEDSFIKKYKPQLNELFRK